MDVQQHGRHAREYPTGAVRARRAIERIMRGCSAPKRNQQIRVNKNGDDRKKCRGRLFYAAPLRVTSFISAYRRGHVQRGERETVEETYLKHSQMWIGVDCSGCLGQSTE